MARQGWAGRGIAVLRSVYPLIPKRFSYVALYHEALARLAGREKPPALTQFLNRFWIGQTSMAVGKE